MTPHATLAALMPGPFLLQHPSAVATLEGLRAGLGGAIRKVPDDFLVEEIPLFRPSGRGEHTIAQVEKRETSTFDVLLFLSKALKVSERVIGYAGLKDARAVARQYVSLPKVDPRRVLAVRHRRFRVLSAARHERPLKIGYLQGNRFTIRIRDPDLRRFDAAGEALEKVVARGLPNAYGSQRFGVRQDGHLLGRAMLHEQWQEFVDQLLGRPSPVEMNPQIVAARHAYDRGDLDEARELFPLKHRSEKKAAGVLQRGGAPQEAFEAIGSGPRRIWLSAWQSYLFNRLLDRRVRDGTYDRLLPGDIAWLHESGAMVAVSDAEAPCAAGPDEASPTGPLVGYDLRRAQGAPGRLEREILDADGADPEAFRAAHGKARGLRRPLCVPVREASLSVESDDAVVARFVLPPGSFATVVLDHLMPSSDPREAAEPGAVPPRE
jgi:tRNA pseudouridine13 synthase